MLAKHRGWVVISECISWYSRVGMDRNITNSHLSKQKQTNKKHPTWVKGQFLLLSFPFPKLTCWLSEKETQNTQRANLLLAAGDNLSVSFEMRLCARCWRQLEKKEHDRQKLKSTWRKVFPPKITAWVSNDQNGKCMSFFPAPCTSGTKEGPYARGGIQNGCWPEQGCWIASHPLTDYMLKSVSKEV